MLSMTIPFLDLEDKEVERTFYFRFTQAEVMKEHILHEKDGGYTKWLESVVESGDGQLIIDTFEHMIATAVGVKLEDGITFRKTPEITEQFMSSDAYSEFFTEIVTDANAAARFFSAVVPQKLSRRAQAAVDKLNAEEKANIAGEAATDVPVAPTSTDDERKWEDYSQEELLAMPDDQFEDTFGTDPRKWASTPNVLQAAFTRRTTAK